VSGHHLLVDLHHAAIDLDAGQSADKPVVDGVAERNDQRVARDLLTVAGGWGRPSSSSSRQENAGGAQLRRRRMASP
jgi:hypothetical protein